jgi:hypothetical protein
MDKLIESLPASFYAFLYGVSVFALWMLFNSITIGD